MFLLNHLNNSWHSILIKEFEKNYFKNLNQRLENVYHEKEIWPIKEEIFSAFNHCSIENIKVVILGQDPYPTPNHAHGLCFSVKSHVRPFPKSLNNIFKELKGDLNIESPENGNLERWSKQGVFLLNSVLTVEAHEANSHKDFGWKTFTDEVIQTISKNKENVVFLLWGAQAQKKIELIDTKKHHILKSVHPSPLSAYRGFFGSKHFSKTNEILISQNLSPINW